VSRPWSFRRLALTESEVLLKSASAYECFASKSFNFRKKSTALLLTDKKTRRLGTCCYRRTVRRDQGYMVPGPRQNLARPCSNYIYRTEESTSLFGLVGDRTLPPSQSPWVRCRFFQSFVQNRRIGYGSAPGVGMAEKRQCDEDC